MNSITIRLVGLAITIIGLLLIFGLDRSGTGYGFFSGLLAGVGIAMLLTGRFRKIKRTDT